MLFQPATVGILAFIGSTDLREARRKIGIGHALFNRSQIAVSVMTASWVFHSLGGDLHVWPRVLFLAMLVLSVDILVNGSLVLFARQVAMGAPLGEEIIGLLGGSPFPSCCPTFVLGWLPFFWQSFTKLLEIGLFWRS